MVTFHSYLAAVLLAQVEAPRVDSVGVLSLALPPGPGAALAEIATELREAIAGRRAGVVEPRQLRLRMSGPTGPTLEELDRAFEGARAASLAGDHQGSVRALRSVVEEMEKLPDGAETFSQCVRAVTRLARSELDLGHTDTARSLLERLVRAAPDLELDRDLHPGRFLQLLENARSVLRSEPTHRLAVTASGPGARVYLNRRDVGSAPLELVLARGQYRLSGLLGSARVLPVTADIREADGSVLLDFTVPESFCPDLGPGLALPEEDRSRRVVAAGGYLGLAEIVTARLLVEGSVSYLVGTLYDVRRGMLVREGRVRLEAGALPGGGAAALAEFLVSGSTASGLVEIPGRREAEPPPSPPRALGWTALATGIGTVGIAAFAALETRSASANYREARNLRSGGLGTYEAVVQYNRAVDRGDAARRDATAAWVVAGVGAVATGVIGYLNYRRTGEFGPFRF